MNARTENRSVYVVIPVFNNWGQARACLKALAASTYAGVKIILVDHGTQPMPPAAIAGYANVKRIAASSDAWWAEATNIGVRAALAAGADSIMLLNDDCHVLPDTISKLVAHAQRLGANAIVAPVLRDRDTQQLATNTATTCFLLGFPTLPLPHRLRPHVGRDVAIRTALIMGGRGALIPSQVFAKVGLLASAALPHYGADHDFYLRCRRHGMRLYIAADATAIVNDQRTTQAANTAALTVREFLATFSSRRSHRNLRDLTTLFKNHYPIPGLHLLGVTLNVMRYVVLYSLRRAVYLIKRKLQRP